MSNADVPCKDYLEFEERLKAMRVIDDRIIYQLNTILPTVSFSEGVNLTSRCEALYKQLMSAYKARSAAINKCLVEVQNQVEHYRHIKDENPDDIGLLKKLKNEQYKLRLMQNEVNVEEVLKDRSLKVFYERCRSSYKPEDLLP